MELLALVCSSTNNGGYYWYIIRLVTKAYGAIFISVVVTFIENNDNNEYNDHMQASLKWPGCTVIVIAVIILLRYITGDQLGTRPPITDKPTTYDTDNGANPNSDPIHP